MQHETKQTFTKRPTIRRRKTAVLTAGKDDKCKAEDWHKHFRMGKEQIMKLVD